jgi:hypothetical protein
LKLSDDLKFVSVLNRFFKDSTPQCHYVIIFLAVHAEKGEELQNVEPDKYEGWKWMSASDIADDSGNYRPLFVPLDDILMQMRLIGQNDAYDEHVCT